MRAARGLTGQQGTPGGRGPERGPRGVAGGRPGLSRQRREAERGRRSRGPRPPGLRPRSGRAGSGAGRVRGTAGIAPEITRILSSFLPRVKTKASCGAGRSPRNGDAILSAPPGGAATVAGFFPARFPGQPPRARPPLGQPRVSPRTARKQKRCCVPFLPLDANKKSHHHVWSFRGERAQDKSNTGTKPAPAQTGGGRRRATPARPQRASALDELAPDVSPRARKQASIRDAETRGPGVRGTVGTRQTPLTTLRSLTVALQTLHPA